MKLVTFFKTMKIGSKLRTILCPNWLLCTVVILAILAASLFEFFPLQFLEYKSYDFMASQRKREDSSPVVIVAIDDKSIKDIGSWPWPRSYVADMVRRLAEYRPNTMGLCLLYPGEELNPGLQEIRSIRETLPNEPSLKKKHLEKIDAVLAKAEKRLNHDSRLISAVKSAVKIVLPIYFTLGPSELKDAPEMSEWLKMNSLNMKKHLAKLKTQSSSLENIEDMLKDDSLAAGQITTPFEQLSTKARALGHVNFVPDPDGVVRTTPLLISYRGRHFFSLGLQVAAKTVGARVRDLKLGRSENGAYMLRLKTLKIPTDRYYRMLIDFNAQHTNFKKFSFSDVLSGEVPARAFRKKIVLIGLTARRLAPMYKTTLGENVTDVEITANVVENIVNRKHLARPGWTVPIEILAIVFFSFLLLFVIPRVNNQVGALLLAMFLVAWVGIASLCFMAFGYWLKIFPPILLSVLGYAVVRYESFHSKKQDESAELNKTLGLSFQGKGMLDMAFEKFLKCPVRDESVKGLLYNLALDFERKRMFSKALAVYEHILKAGNFKDIPKRIEKLRNIGDNIVLSPGSAGQDATLLLENAVTNPTLGRYEILKELGQGAMGTVYLGRDAKINREVAIKTLSYGEIEADDLEDVKTRFFREAEAAGNLSHPYIATIFDVGEDYDMAYIAMELIKGENLTVCCRKENLLPVNKALAVVSQVAEALDCAHGRGVVHRDIKPANIMLFRNDHVKVTDFGIARLNTSSKKTQTGTLIGTPSYMSPEQVAGKRVDGRSDLFSLGVVFYELLTGEKPFKGDNMAALMYSIAKASYIPLAEVAPDIPPCCVAIIDKLLAKGVTKRFKTGGEVVAQIQLCLEKLDKATKPITPRAELVESHQMHGTAILRGRSTSKAR